MQRHRVLFPLVALVFAASAAPVFAADPVSKYDEPGRGTAPRTGVAPAGVPNVNPNTAPGANGKIVYARSPFLEWPNRLWTVNATGAGAAQFTTNSVGTGDSWPEWSPGGTLIAFSRDLTASEVDGGNEIFTIRADKTGLQRITTNNAHDVSPAFSPDGSRIVFMSNRDGNAELYTMNLNGSNIRRITNNVAYDSQADWSPDGTKIAFVSDRAGGADIYTIKPDGTGLKRLTPWAGDDFAPSWSPDGSVIAYTSDRVDGEYHLFTMDPNGGQITWIDTDTGIPALRPSWSPDGTQIAFDSYSPEGDADVYVLVADGSVAGAAAIANTGDDEWAPSWQPIPDFPLVDARFSTFETDIEWVYAEGITFGCSTERYCADAVVTRGEMATFIDRALHLPLASGDFFTDDGASPHESSINRVRQAGITSGCTATTYCPNAAVTREQMATFLSRAFGLPSTTTDYFTDDESSQHEVSINRVRAAGITSGCTPTTYCPSADVTRGQMAAFLRRALEE